MTTETTKQARTDELVNFIVAWLREQAQKHGPFAPYVDVDDPRQAVLDGEFDIAALADAIAQAEETGDDD